MVSKMTFWFDETIYKDNGLDDIVVLVNGHVCYLSQVKLEWLRWIMFRQVVAQKRVWLCLAWLGQVGLGRLGFRRLVMVVLVSVVLFLSKVRLGQVTSGSVRSGWARLAQARLGQGWLSQDRLRSVMLWLSELSFAWLRLAQVDPCQARPVPCIIKVL